jgi:glucose/arabinose dehydrogenase
MEVEHGPRGGDELSLIEKGKDYGWPLVFYGENHKRLPISKPETPPDLAMPGALLGASDRGGQSDVLPRGAKAFPQWNGNCFINGLAAKGARPPHL